MDSTWTKIQSVKITYKYCYCIDERLGKKKIDEYLNSKKNKYENETSQCNS